MLECVAFNLPFWTTLAASTDTAAAENTLGPGLTRTDDGLLRVTDPTQAYLDVAADGTSRYARVDLVSPRDLPGEDKPLDTFHLRVDGDGSAGRTQSMSARSPRSLYLNTDAGATLRVWVQEAKGALVPILAVRANERVPFSWSWTRVAALACAVLLVLAWRPGSRLWRTRLDPRTGASAGAGRRTGAGCAADLRQCRVADRHGGAAVVPSAGRLHLRFRPVRACGRRPDARPSVAGPAGAGPAGVRGESLRHRHA
ncbi:MAG: hypothetical protein ACLTGO_09045 [Bifidobacterium scardovii]